MTGEQGYGEARNKNGDASGKRDTADGKRDRACCGGTDGQPRESPGDGVGHLGTPTKVTSSGPALNH